VERFKHTFVEMLSMNFSSCHDEWDEIVDFMVFPTTPAGRNRPA
jgi:hypothetical protein